MILFGFFALSLICVWVIVRPLLLSEADSAFQTGLSEIQYSECQDLKRFQESLEFEHARGLIGEAEFEKQKVKVQHRLATLEGTRKTAGGDA